VVCILLVLGLGLVPLAVHNTKVRWTWSHGGIRQRQLSRELINSATAVVENPLTGLGSSQPASSQRTPHERTAQAPAFATVDDYTGSPLLHMLLLGHGAGHP
jgi:hypothetical protein